MSLLLLAALRLETSIASLCFQTKTRSRAGNVPVVTGGVDGTQVIVARTGVGCRRAEAATRQAVQTFRPSAVVCFGIAGGLSASVAAGDVIVATEVMVQDGARGSMSYYPSDRLLAGATDLLHEEGLAFTLGALLTVHTPLRSASEKTEAHIMTGAIAVEMESASIARVCREAGIDFFALRAISDPLATRLPRGLPGLFSPWSATANLRLLRGVAKARRNLRPVIRLLSARLARA